MSLLSVGQIQRVIYLVRGHKVMLDSDLARLYGVATGHLNRAVKRNIKRFPYDFMFQLTMREYANLRCQIGILEKGRHAKYLPYVFTQDGVSMLSSVLKSERAIQVNIAIMRAFGRLQKWLASHKDLARKLNELERKYDSQFKVVFDAIRQLMTPDPSPPPLRIRGFKND